MRIDRAVAWKPMRMVGHIFADDCRKHESRTPTTEGRSDGTTESEMLPNRTAITTTPMHYQTRSAEITNRMELSP